MTTIPETTKSEITNSGARFNRNPRAEKPINGGVLEVAKRAVGNAIEDDKPYSIRINFQNGRIVGSEAKPRLTVELLDGRSATSAIGTQTDTSFVEIDSLTTEGFPPITNEGSWVVRLTVKNGDIVSVFVNPDFPEEDRKLIKKVLMRGFDAPIHE